jgi:cytidine deaminase
VRKMKQSQVTLAFEKYRSTEELAPDDANLLFSARQAIGNAYTPYSGFKVGAAAKLSDAAIVTGSNQENASFPVGMCAERVLLGAVSSLHPTATILTIAITYKATAGNSDHPVAPCGLCRQSLYEYQVRSGQPIRLVLAGFNGPVLVIPDARQLLPLAFSGDELK